MAERESADEALYKYCVFHRGTVTEERGTGSSRKSRKRPLPATDKNVFNDCSKVYLIDGQDFSLNQLISDFYGKPPSNPDFLKRGNLLKDQPGGANDSIHFQQWRALELAEALIKQIRRLSLPFRIAVIGGGIAGVTFAKRLKSTENVVVEVFEHHQHLIPRMFKAYGRHVHPYHHLLEPYDEIIRLGDTFTHSCPILGADKTAKGGIPNILEWEPGEISRVTSKLDNQITLTDLEKKLSQRVRAIEPKTDESGRECFALGTQDFSIVEHMGEAKTHDDVDEGTLDDKLFHIVVLAPGGAREVKRYVGQTSGEYWRPNLLTSLPPRRTPYKVAIVGGGNTAASELFACLFKNSDFLEVVSTIKKYAQNDTEFEALISKSFHATAPEGKMRYTSELLANAELKIKKFFDEHPGIVYPKTFVEVALLLRKDDGDHLDFPTMNALNRFLTLLLVKSGRVSIIEYNDPNRSKTFKTVDSSRHGQSILFFDGKKMGKKHGFTEEVENRDWDWLLNCKEPKRKYHEVFDLQDAVASIQWKSGAAHISGEPLAKIIQEKGETVNSRWS